MRPKRNEQAFDRHHQKHKLHVILFVSFFVTADGDDVSCGYDKFDDIYDDGSSDVAINRVRIYVPQNEL